MADVEVAHLALDHAHRVREAQPIGVESAWQARPPGIGLLVPTFEDRPGHPIVFDPGVRTDVQQASGGAGVREWRRIHPGQVRTLPVEHTRHVTDIDTPEDLAGLAREHGVRLHWPQA